MKFTRSSHRCRDGMAVIVMMTLLSIMAIYVMTSMRSLSTLDRELKLLERNQIKRLASLSASAAQTNSPPAAQPEKKPQ